MTININPNRINIAANPAKKALEQRRRQAGGPVSDIPMPKRAHVNIIPEPESLATLIRSAVAAFRQGVFWDRGTILNLLA